MEISTLTIEKGVISRPDAHFKIGTWVFSLICSDIYDVEGLLSLCFSLQGLTTWLRQVAMLTADSNQARPIAEIHLTPLYCRNAPCNEGHVVPALERWSIACGLRGNSSSWRQVWWREAVIPGHSLYGLVYVKPALSRTTAPGWHIISHLDLYLTISSGNTKYAHPKEPKEIRVLQVTSTSHKHRVLSHKFIFLNSYQFS